MIGENKGKEWEAELESARKWHAKQVAVLRKRFEEEMSSLSVAETDFEVVHADLRDREAQLANLQAALTQLEQDNIQQAENLKLNFQRQLTELHRTNESDIKASKAEDRKSVE